MKFGKGLTGRIWIFIPVLSFLFVQQVNSQYLKARDTQIVDASGNNIILRGMGLGGWMLQEGYMLQIHNDGTQHSIKARITDLIGKENCDRFYDLWLQNHMTKPDVDSLTKWGFNSIRLPMHYNLFTPAVEQEPVKGENTWLTKGFELVDNLLSWCKANNIYLILDLHAAPGGQGKDSNISDYDESKPSLWESEENKLKTIALWRKLAERYANEPNIGGYDLVNEPNWTFEGKNRNGLEDTKNEAIWELYRRITTAIREVDNNHMIIIEGNGWGNNYNGFVRPWDGNMVLSFHKYWNPNDQKSISHITAAREKYNMPVWLGESGENSDTWFTDCISVLEKNNIGWSWWPLKKINSVVCPLMVIAPPEYKQIADYFNNEGPRPSSEMATQVLLTVAGNTNVLKCRFNKDVPDAIFRQRKESGTIRFSANQVPGIIQASDFDLGKQGFAYNDSEYENTGQEGHKDGNKGDQYRNDGVDIIHSTDKDSKSNGFQVTSVGNGEWMQYTVDVARNGTYHVSARIASEVSGGRFKVVFFKKPPVTNEDVPSASTGIYTMSATGSQTEWKTADTGEVKLEKGVYCMRVIIDRGGFELGWISIQ